MAEYIVQDALSDFRDDIISEFIELCGGNDYNKLSLLKIGDTIDNIYDKHIEKHSTADVVEVVRCKDCKHAHGIDDKEPVYACTNPEIYGIGSRGAIVCVSGHFCSYGKRKGDGE